MRIVLDTSVLVAAIRSEKGASKRLVEAGLLGHVRLLISVPLVLEYEAVMGRPEHLAVAGVSLSEIDVLIDALCRVCEPVHLAFLWRPMLSDPEDEMVLETAVNGAADAIVTFNRRDFTGVAARFGIDVLTPGEAWERMKP